MGQAIGDLLRAAVGVAISPIPIIAVAAVVLLVIGAKLVGDATVGFSS